MSVSFEKHRQKIISAWKDVLNDKILTDWALFGYEGQTNELKLVSTGEGGLDELCDDLNSGKIMYAFVRINETKTGLTKFLLINWQGEGAPVLRKATCANHIHDISKVLAGAHLTINARVDDDIDQERLLQKLRNITASMTLNEPRITQDEQKAPVGTNYSRVIPAKELNPVEMLNFWKKEEEEERHRIELEKERKRLELIKREEEQRAREEKEHREREKKIAENTKLQSAHVPIKTSPQPLSPIKTLSSPTRVMTEAEKMRQQRSQEARELIGSRVGTAKAIFTQNTSDGQLQTTKNAPVKPVRNSIAQRINALNNPQNTDIANEVVEKNIPVVSEEPIVVETIPEIATETINIQDLNDENASLGSNQQNDDDFVEHEEQYSTIKRSPHSKSNSLASPEEPSITDPQSQNSSETPKTEIRQAVNGQSSDGVSDEDIIYQDFLSDGGLKARALYDYQAADESEITFDPGDIITHIDQIDEGWWQGLGPDGTYGLFPANYVELIN